MIPETQLSRTLRPANAQWAFSRIEFRSAEPLTFGMVMSKT